MLVDCMTKQLDTEVFMRILRKGEWSIVRDEECINPRTKKSSKQQQQQPQPLARGPGVVDVPTSGGQAGHRSETDAPEPVGLRIHAFKPRKG